MSKTNFKTGDKVTVLKSGMLENLPGVILSNHTDTGFKPLSVMLDNQLGVWQLNYEDVALISKEKPIKVDHRIAEPETSNNRLENLTVATLDKPKKRAYKKRGTAKEGKPKRKYVKKASNG